MIKKIFFDITNHCNADCLHCFTLSNSYNEEPELSNDLISKILSSLNDYGLSSVSIGGGEPLTRNLFDILGNKTFETQFSITTNGTILDDKLLDVLIKNRFKITVSLDSLSQSTT